MKIQPLLTSNIRFPCVQYYAHFILIVRQSFVHREKEKERIFGFLSRRNLLNYFEFSFETQGLLTKPSQKPVHILQVTIRSICVLKKFQLLSGALQWPMCAKSCLFFELFCLYLIIYLVFVPFHILLIISKIIIFHISLFQFFYKKSLINPYRVRTPV